MLNQELRNKVDRLWDNFWTGGISNPLTVIEQISYLLFIKRLDEIDQVNEKRANRIGKSHNSIFPDKNLKWSEFKHFAAQPMFENMLDNVFPFIKNFGKGDSVFTQYMKDAVFLIQKPGLLHEAVQLIDGIKMDDTDTKGDLYEYLLSKLSTAGVNGQFRTPRHIINMIVELVDPTAEDKICDPACGTAGFLIAATEHILRKYTSPDRVFTDEDGIVHDKIGDLLSAEQRKYIEKSMFYGFDFDTSMLRISAMNMILHGIENPSIYYADSLSSSYEEADKYTVVLANPPFKGSLDEGDINPSLKKVVKTKKTELLFLALFERILDLGGRCAAIVPDGVLFGSSTAHKAIRKMIVEENQLEAVISMPSGVFKPYAGVSAAIVLFTKGGQTDKVWFYDMTADGYSLDDKRSPVEANDIPDIISSWKGCKANKESAPEKDYKWFWVEKNRIVENDYDLSISKYKEIEYEDVEYEKPEILLGKIEALERDILTEIAKLKELMIDVK